MHESAPPPTLGRPGIMHRSRSGFTIIELIIAIVIGSILTSIALSRISGAQTRMAVRGAQTTFAAVNARARAHGIEKGENVIMGVDAVGDSAWIQHDGEVLEIVRFDEENIDLQISSPSITEFTVCYSPRGYPAPGCGTTLPMLVRMHFVRGGETVSLWRLPMGQLLLD